MAEHEQHHEQAHGGESHAKHGGGHGGGGHGGGGHGEEHEGAPEWLISFADNVALLMGFFVILLAMNMKEPTSGGIGGKEKNGGFQTSEERMLDLYIGLREAFNNPVNLASTNPKDQALIRRIVQRREGTAIEDGPKGQRQNVESVRPTDYRRLGGLVVFEENGTEVDEHGQGVIKEVTRQLKGRKTIVEIRGHTSLAEAYQPLDRGMKLSYDRAFEVATRLHETGLEWDQLRIVAVGPGDRATPLARSSGEHRNNQRVEIILTDENLPPDPYSNDPNSKAPAPESAPAGPSASGSGHGSPPKPKSAPSAHTTAAEKNREHH